MIEESAHIAIEIGIDAKLNSIEKREENHLSNEMANQIKDKFQYLCQEESNS